MRLARNAALLIGSLAIIAGLWYGIAYMNAKGIVIDDAKKLEHLIEDVGEIAIPSDEQLDRIVAAMDALSTPVAVRLPIILASTTIPTHGQLEDASKLFGNLLTSMDGLAGSVATKKARQLEPKVWDLFRRRIEKEILDIKSDIGKNATLEAIQRVDNLFFKFVPTLTESSAAEHAALRDKWNAEKDSLLEQHIVQNLIDNVERPLDNLAGRHGEKSIADLFGLYGDLAKAQPPKDAEKLVAKKAELAKRLDGRMAEEFRFLIDRDLAAGLPEAKAAEASKRLAEQLAVWNPATEDGFARKETIEKLLKAKTSEAGKKWMAEQRQICDEWVKNEIANQPKRSVAGQNGLFSAYQFFARKNAANPFFGSIVQKAVYDRVEQSFTDNLAWFEKNGGGKASFWNDKANFAANWKTVVIRLQGFRQLCSEVSTDTNPRQSSWAWHFARLCMKQGRLETNRQTEYFPRQIVIDRIVASANYHGNRPTAYKYTAFGARIDIGRFNDNGTPSDGRSEVLLPFERDGRDAKDSENNALKAPKEKKDGAKEKTLLLTRRTIDIHAFERADLKLVATDWNSGTGARKSSPIKTLSLAWAEKAPFAPAGTGFDLSFKLDRWSGDKHPALSLTIYGRIEGPSIADLFEQAKADAKAVK